jgi:nitroimidazol reductase NimA-like FMN-containing flavoprotein (pyridoxamine 5'-phosphate oxidase superfamily)
MFRKMRRFKQQVSREECLKVLKNGIRGVLAVSGDDGYPYAVPIDYWYDEENDRFYFHGAAVGHKIDAIDRNDKVSFCVMDEGYIENESGWKRIITSVITFGRMKRVEDPAEQLLIARRIAEKVYPDEKTIDDEVSKYKTIPCLELTPEHMTGKKVREA